MFEPFYGLKAAPFQLSPDPSFYFESRGHGHALSYLKFGVYQQEGFIVVTGEIGAGKTTLVRTLLQGLDPEQVVAAQVVNTQLNEGELLASICNAFGVPVQGTSKAQLVSTLEAFFIAVAPDGSYAGVSMLFHPQAGDHLNTGLTGVHPAWRRCGIALTLKRQAIAYAKTLGVPEIRTDNASTNVGMLAINESLGFVRYPAWISYEKPVAG